MSLHMSFRCKFVFLFVLTVSVFGVGSLGTVGFSQLFMQRNVGGVVVDPDGVMWEIFLTEGITDGLGYRSEEMPENSPAAAKR